MSQNSGADSGGVGVYDMDDARFRIRPYQQVVSSCTGAFITSLTSE